MSVRFPCVQCGKKLKVDAASVGRSLLCPACGAKQTVPNPASIPAEMAAKPGTSHSSDPPALAALLAPKSAHAEDLIDMTAMVDIVFFLLIFFLFTSMQAVQAVMDFPTPQARQGAAGKAQTIADYENDPDFITVRIEDDNSVWVEDEQVFGEQNLRVKLRSLREAGSGPRSLLVVGHADATHGTAVMVFDAGADAGLDDIRLSVQENPGESAE